MLLATVPADVARVIRIGVSDGNDVWWLNVCVFTTVCCGWWSDTTKSGFKKWLEEVKWRPPSHGGRSSLCLLIWSLSWAIPLMLLLLLLLLRGARYRCNKFVLRHSLSLLLRSYTLCFTFYFTLFALAFFTDFVGCYCWALVVLNNYY